MKQIVILAALAVVAVVLYLFFPSAARIANQADQAVKQKEVGDNWEYYYDQEVQKMESRLGDFQKVREEALKDAKRTQDQRDLLAKKVADANQLIERVSNDYKAAVAAGLSTVVVNGDSRDLAAAREQLAVWIEDRMLVEAELKTSEEMVSAIAERNKKNKALFQKAQAHVAAIKREKSVMRAKLAAQDLEERLRVLEQLTNDFVNAKDVEGLANVRNMVADKLLSGEARRQLSLEEDNIDKNVGLGEALLNQTAEQKNAAVKDELDARLGVPAK